MEIIHRYTHTPRLLCPNIGAFEIAFASYHDSLLFQHSIGSSSALALINEFTIHAALRIMISIFLTAALDEVLCGLGTSATSCSNLYADSNKMDPHVCISSG